MNMAAYRPTHTVPAGGLPAWASPDAGQPASGRLDPWLQVQVLQWWGQWANVQCSNGWTAWVDGTALQPVGAPAPPPPMRAAPPGPGYATTGSTGASYALPVGLVAAGLVVVGPFLSWMSISGFDLTAFRFPIDFLWTVDAEAKVDADPVSIGGLVAVLGVVIAALALAQRPVERRLVGAVAGAVCIVFAIELARSLNQSPDAPGLFSALGVGVYVSLAGAVIALIAGGRARRAR